MYGGCSRGTVLVVSGGRTAVLPGTVSGLLTEMSSPEPDRRDQGTRVLLGRRPAVTLTAELGSLACDVLLGRAKRHWEGNFNDSKSSERYAWYAREFSFDVSRHHAQQQYQ